MKQIKIFSEYLDAGTLAKDVNKWISTSKANVIKIKIVTGELRTVMVIYEI